MMHLAAKACVVAFLVAGVGIGLANVEPPSTAAVQQGLICLPDGSGAIRCSEAGKEPFPDGRDMGAIFGQAAAHQGAVSLTTSWPVEFHYVPTNDPTGPVNLAIATDIFPDAMDEMETFRMAAFDGDKELWFVEGVHEREYEGQTGLMQAFYDIPAEFRDATFKAEFAGHKWEFVIPEA